MLIGSTTGGGGGARAPLSWTTRPALSPRAALVASLALLAALLLLEPGHCRRRKLHEAELHARGLFRSPRLGADAFIARRLKGSGEFEVLLARVCKGMCVLFWWRFVGWWWVDGGRRRVVCAFVCGSPCDARSLFASLTTTPPCAPHIPSLPARPPQRTKAPFEGAWCVVGGFVNYMEDPLDALRREIAEETALSVDAAVRRAGGYPRRLRWAGERGLCCAFFFALFCCVR